MVSLHPRETLLFLTQHRRVRKKEPGSKHENQPHGVVSHSNNPARLTSPRERQSNVHPPQMDISGRPKSKFTDIQCDNASGFTELS